MEIENNVSVTTFAELVWIEINSIRFFWGIPFFDFFLCLFFVLKQ